MPGIENQSKLRTLSLVAQPVERVEQALSRQVEAPGPLPVALNDVEAVGIEDVRQSARVERRIMKRGERSVSVVAEDQRYAPGRYGFARPNHEKKCSDGCKNDGQHKSAPCRANIRVILPWPKKCGGLLAAS
jgi:hypothetical protein